MGKRFTQSEFSNIEDYKKAIEFNKSRVIQICNGTANNTITTIKDEGFSFVRFTTSCTTVFEGCNSEDNFQLVFIKSERPIIVNGLTLYKTDLILIPPTEKVVIVYPAEFVGFHLQIHKRLMANLIGLKPCLLLQGIAAQLRQNSKSLYFLESFNEQVTNLLDSIFENFVHLDDIDIIDKHNLLAQLIIRLFNNVQNLEVAQSKHNTRFEVVKRAIAFIDSNNQNHITVNEVAKNSFCSLRTLEYSFHEVLSISPRDYIKLKRLTKIRKTLLNTSEFDTVGQVLKEQSIPNTGRFSKDYYKAFNEYPKETLKKGQFRDKE